LNGIEVDPEKEIIVTIGTTEAVLFPWWLL